MPEISLLPTESTLPPSTHPVHRATALLQEALHDSRRATFTQEFGEVRGIHRLSAPPSAEVFVDNDQLDGLALMVGRGSTTHADREYQTSDAWPAHDTSVLDGRTAQAPVQDSTSTHAADPQLRGLIHDFRERQRKAGLIVAASIASAVSLTVVTIAFVFALAA